MGQFCREVASGAVTCLGLAAQGSHESEGQGTVAMGTGVSMYGMLMRRLHELKTT